MNDDEKQYLTQLGKKTPIEKRQSTMILLVTLLKEQYLTTHSDIQDLHIYFNDEL